MEFTEGERFEFKRTATDQIVKIGIAFANWAGGTIDIGVEALEIRVSDNALLGMLPNKNRKSLAEGLSLKESAVMYLFEKSEDITRKAVEEVLGVSQTMAGRVLRQLVEKGENRGEWGGSLPYLFQKEMRQETNDQGRFEGNCRNNVPFAVE